ncbi:esterase [Roseateles sp.]|uniref:esterase n=1 Tax=Roseateles sp. TaxID=1971397 RepID=UPI0039EA97AD
MSPQDLIVQRPAVPKQLVLLFHGVGSSAQDMVPLGRALAPQLPDALIASVQAPDAAGRGWQWFSVQDVTESNRPTRVAQAMPGFVRAVQQWQQHGAVGPAHTTLIGFSQGAIMALESTQLDAPPAGRVIALSGRFAQPPRLAHAGLQIHLVHGDADTMMPVRGAVDALAQLRSLGADATLDRLPGLGHGIDARVVDAIARGLRREEALKAQERSPSELAADFAAVTGARAVDRHTLLHIGEEQLVLLCGQGRKAQTEHRLDLGAARIARDFFRHDPPTAHEIEQAIDFAEEQIMRLGPRQEGGDLWSPSAGLRPWSAISGPMMTIETVEQWFGRLALAAQGRVGALEGLPQGRKAAATLLVLREFMHHRGHSAITVVQPQSDIVISPATTK